jgi:hypothetical protein
MRWKSIMLQSFGRLPELDELRILPLPALELEP